MVCPMTKPTAIDGMTRDELDSEIGEGIESCAAGKVYSADEVDEMFLRRLTIKGTIDTLRREASTMPELTLEEINDEIRAARTERAKRK